MATFFCCPLKLYYIVLAPVAIVDELAILEGYMEELLWNLLHLPRKINNSQDALHSSLSGTHL